MTPMSESIAPAPGVLRFLADLLRGPDAPAPGPAPPTLAFARFVIGCWAAYGFVAGAYQGGSQLVVAAAKAPLIVVGALALCLPSLVVLTSFSGTDWTPSRLAAFTAAYAAALSVLPLALIPIVWLFSATTRSLGYLVFVHLLAWSASLVVAARFAARLLGGRLRLGWSALLLVVSLQCATLAQPVLYRSPGEPLWPLPRETFFAQLEQAARVHLGPTPGESE